jgi:two-component system sensor histidine kinase DesK
MTVATTADIERQAARKLERYRRITYRSFLFAAAGYVVPCVLGLAVAYGEGDAGVPVVIAAAAGLVVMTWLYARLVRTGMEGGASRRDMLLSAAVALALSLLILVHFLFVLVPATWLSAVVLSPMSRRPMAALCAGTAAVLAAITTAATAGDGRDPLPAFLMIFALDLFICWLVVFVHRYQRRMWELHQETYAARDALARLAVTEERLRFSRDLHDLLGHTLSLIAVKSELGMRLIREDPGRAEAEMADVRRAARDALREVRAAVEGYRAVELDAELAGVRAVLEAAGVRCEIAEPPRDLPAAVRAVLGWVIREGTTNVIKHSEARRCAITLAHYGGSVVLEMRNDGVRDTEPGTGSGLTGLAERVAVLGGELTSGRHGRDGFLLRAVVPVPGEEAAVPAVPAEPAEPAPAQRTPV